MRILTSIIFSLSLLASPAFGQVTVKTEPVNATKPEPRTPNLFPKGTQQKLSQPFNAQLRFEGEYVFGHRCDQYFSLIPNPERTKYVTALVTKQPVSRALLEIEIDGERTSYSFLSGDKKKNKNIRGCGQEKRIESILSKYDGPPASIVEWSIQTESVTFN